MCFKGRGQVLPLTPQQQHQCLQTHERTMDHLNGRVDEDVASGVEPRFFCFCFGGLFGEGEGPGAAELDVDEDITAKSLTTSTSCSTIEQLEACSFLRFGTELFIFHRRTEGTIPLDVTGEHENENEYGYKRRRRRERTLIDGLIVFILRQCVQGIQDLPKEEYVYPANLKTELPAHWEVCSIHSRVVTVYLQLWLGPLN